MPRVGHSERRESVMKDRQILTAEQFAARRPDLPENGRWIELVEGRLVQLDPPDDIHGNVVLNLSKAMADYLQTNQQVSDGYLCFELGLLVHRDPDTIHFPAASYLTQGPRFAESDQIYIDFPPRLVIEIASTNRRRRGLVDRVKAYQKWGVEEIWIADGLQKQMHVVETGRGAISYNGQQSLSGSSVLRDFRVDVGALFKAPDWWK